MSAVELENHVINIADISTAMKPHVEYPYTIDIMCRSIEKKDFISAMVFGPGRFPDSHPVLKFTMRRNEGAPEFPSAPFSAIYGGVVIEYIQKVMVGAHCLTLIFGKRGGLTELRRVDKHSDMRNGSFTFCMGSSTEY